MTTRVEVEPLDGILVNQVIHPDTEAHVELEKTWQNSRGFLGWVASTNHKDVGKRFMLTAFVFFLLAGLLALAMRLQLARPELTLLDADRYNQFFTSHGTAMMFLFAVPVMEALGIYLVPLMIGTRNAAFPRMMNFSYYLFLFSGITFFALLLFDMAGDQGWFSYVPLAGPGYSPGKRVDLWLQVVTMLEISTLTAAVEVVGTVFKLRAPYMSLHRIPLFVWAQLITAFMIIFAMPAVILCSLMLELDRLGIVGTHFYNPAEGGDALLWQHLFWIFGHPEVYIIFIPATGIVSAILATFCRRAVFGYTALVTSMVAVAFIGFGVWVHHMFATPLPKLGQGLFTASSLLITIPNGIQIFCWLATLWTGKVFLKPPLLFVIGFLLVFVIGGLTGVMVASVSLDTQLHDTYFVVAHFHYVLIGGALFPLFGAFYYWYPKWTGRMLSERLGTINAVLLFVAFNLTFFPMHQLGLDGMPRRIYTYGADTGWANLNLLATIGAGLLGLSVLLLIWNGVISYWRGSVAGPNPWGAGTLEWSVPSPPPAYNFIHPPAVSGRHPLWEKPEETPVVVGMRVDVREMLATTTHDAIPHHRYEMAGASIWPSILALVVVATVLSVNLYPMGAVIGLGVVTLVLIAWSWPGVDIKRLQAHGRQEPEEEENE